MRRYHYENRAKILARKRLYSKTNREKCNESTKCWLAAHPGYISQHNKEYYKKNKEKLLKKNAVWQTRQRQTNPLFRLRQNLSDRIHHCLTNSRSRDMTLKLTGCTIEFLKGWLESRFQPGMSWENYGRSGWHVDHVIPCKAFDFSDPEQVRQCFHYSNLQPLWAADNLRKASSIPIERKQAYGSNDNRFSRNQRPISKVLFKEVVAPCGATFGTGPIWSKGSVP